jgi:hypothetical protein
MTVTPSSPIVGIFKDRAMAEQAIDALYSAGFPSELIRYSAPGASGSILADLKSLFTGQNVTSDTVANDLSTMGLSDAEAQYYSAAYSDGNTILTVSASARAQEVDNILHQYGAYTTNTASSSTATTASPEASDSDQQAAYASEQAPPQQTITPEWATQQHRAGAEDVPSQYDQQDTATSTPASTEAQNAQSAASPAEQTLEDESTQPLAATSHVSAPDDAKSTVAPENQEVPLNTMDDDDAISSPFDSVASNDNSASETAPSSSTTPDAVSETQTTPSNAETYDTPSVLQDTGSEVTPSDSAISDSTLAPEDAQPDIPASDSAASDSTLEPQDTYFTTSSSDDDTTDAVQAPISVNGTANSALQSQMPPVTTTSEHENELQQLLTQLQEAQQQLQEARTQLQAAKEHETYVQTIKERERQLQGARQQLQDIQAQLQATLAELHETQGRISQYQ